MKTAISLPDDLFTSADAYAHRHTLSRSEVYARALREFLQRHDHDSVTAQLNAVCADLDSHAPAEFTEATRALWAADQAGRGEW